MNIIVLLKQAIDMEKVKFYSQKGVTDRESVGAEVNLFNLTVSETAVQINKL